MNDLAPLTKTTGPWIHAWPGDTTDLRDCLTSWEAAAPAKRTVRFIRGRKCTTVAALFDEFAAALQFPDYFGENWDALADCLRDRHPTVVCITEADHLLKADAKALSTFADVLTTCVEDANAPQKPLKPRPMHVIVQAASSKMAATIKRLRAAGLVVETG